MAYVPQIKIGNTTYDIKDSEGREFISMLQNALNANADHNYAYAAYNKNKYIMADGTVGNNSALCCSDFIPVPPNAIRFEMYVLYQGTSPISPICVSYNSNKQKRTTFYGTDHVDGYIAFDLNVNDAYIRFNRSNDHSSDIGKYLFRFITTDMTSDKFDGNMTIGDHDLHNLEVNRIYSLLSEPTGTVLHLPYENWRGNVMTIFGAGNTSGIGRTVLALSSNNRLHVCRSWGNSGTYSDWVELWSDGNIEDKLLSISDFHKVASVNITTGDRNNFTDIPLEAGKLYKIVATAPRENRFRFFCNVNGTLDMNTYVDIGPFRDSAIIKPESDGCLTCFNVDRVESLSGVFYVYEYGKHFIDTEKRIYYVDKNNDYSVYSAYTSLTQCLLDLKDDETEKTIYIEGGDYDIYQEYVDANVPVYPESQDDPTSGYFPYCVWVPKNTHIIGRGLVRLKWMPNKANVTYKQCQAVSPLNVAGSCTIENIEIYCRNGRYCLHNDALGQGAYTGSIQKFINCRFYKYENEDDGNGNLYGKSHTIGFGIDARQRHEFINCEFYNEQNGCAFYGHTRNYVGSEVMNEAKSSNIILRDCVFKSIVTTCVRFNNTNNNSLHVRVTFAGCYFSGKLHVLDGNNGTSGTDPNAFDMTLLNCNNPEIFMANEKYPPKVYPPVVQEQN